METGLLNWPTNGPMSRYCTLYSKTISVEVHLKVSLRNPIPPKAEGPTCLVVWERWALGVTFTGNSYLTNSCYFSSFCWNWSIGLQSFKLFRSYFPTHWCSNLKVLLSVGGWTYSQNGHFNFVTDSGKRNNFVQSAVHLVENYGLDGMSVMFFVMLLRYGWSVLLMFSIVTLITNTQATKSRVLGLLPCWHPFAMHSTSCPERSVEVLASS